MTFVVNAIKQENEKTNSYKFLLDVDSESLWRNIIQSSGIILLSIAKYPGQKTDFWSMYVKVLYQNVAYEIVSNSSLNLKDLCYSFVFLGMDVVDVNSYIDPQSPEQVNKIISFCKTAYTAQKQEKLLEAQKAKEDEEKKKYYEDHLLKRAKVSIEWFLEKISTILQTKEIHIAPKDQKWIDEQLNELKKQRMWSNYEKIKTLLQDLFVFLSSLEDAHYASFSDDGVPIFSQTVVSNYDMKRQVEILEEIKYQTLFGWTLVWWRKEYASLSILPFFLFLKKDFFALSHDIPLLVYRLYDIILYFFIVVFIALSLIFYYNDASISWFDLTSIYYFFVSWGRLALLVYIASFFRKNRDYRFLLALLGAVFFIYYVTLPIIEHSFALK